MRFRRESNPWPSALQANTLCKEPFERRYLLQFGSSACVLQLPPSSWLGIVAEFGSDANIFHQKRGDPNSERGSKALEPLLREREQGARTSEPRENCFTLGSPLCRGLTRAIYILCIEHPRPMCLSRESIPRPPALQANTQCKKPCKRLYWLLFGTSACTTTRYGNAWIFCHIWETHSSHITLK
jgi:hypothetical protein